MVSLGKTVAVMQLSGSDETGRDGRGVPSSKMGWMGLWTDHSNYVHQPERVTATLNWQPGKGRGKKKKEWKCVEGFRIDAPRTGNV